MSTDNAAGEDSDGYARRKIKVGNMRGNETMLRCSWWPAAAADRGTGPTRARLAEARLSRGR